MKSVAHFIQLRYVSRWLVFFIDISIICFALLISRLFLTNLEASDLVDGYDNREIIATIAVSIFFMLVFKTYAGVVRYSTFYDFFRIVWASMSTVIVLIAIDIVSYYIYGKSFGLYHELFLFFFVSVFLMFFFRMIVKKLFKTIVVPPTSSTKTKIVIIGIDSECVSVANAIIHNPTHPYQLKAFINTESNAGKGILLGKRIYSKDSFLKIPDPAKRFDALLLNANMTSNEMDEWNRLALSKGLKSLRSPVTVSMQKENIIKEIRPIQIEDLLDRKPIKIESGDVKNCHLNRDVLVTGGAGSIGSEIVRQISLLGCSTIVVVDQAESPLHELKVDLLEKFPDQNYKFVLADISNSHRLEKLFDDYHFYTVYHAAAYKHVPLIEDNPHEAVFVNILGTRNLALLAKKFKVDRFVMVSTDKAVNPTNVMGASKRAAELFVQALQNSFGNSTKFITTRFGNVLGSNGSVIPHFRKQIEKGGPVTITHPDIIRYFMTIPEACELVLQAGTMGNGGEIYVFDMGQPIKILDLAKRMIILSGYTPDVDIKIEYIGLRPGEKLYEELLTNNSTTVPTHHEKIMISKDPAMDFDDIEFLCRQIVRATVRKDSLQVVKLLKSIVPEFISNNSEFEILDTKSEHEV